MALTEYPRPTWKTEGITCVVCGKLEQRLGGVRICMDCFSWARDVGVVVMYDETEWRFRGEGGSIVRDPGDSAAIHD
jgi:hypothetical protein